MLPQLTMLALVAAAVAEGTPADRVPTPKPKPCIEFAPELGEEGMATPSGVGYAEVKAGLSAVIQHALYCGQPEGMSAVHLTFDLTIRCDGLVSEVVTIDAGGAPDDYVACVAAVIAKADFPGHDMEGGMPVTYPVNVAW